MPTKKPMKLRDQRAFVRSRNQCALAAALAGKTPLQGQFVYPGLEMVWRPPTAKGSARSIDSADGRIFPHLRVVAVQGDHAVVRGLNWAECGYPHLGFMPLRTLLENFTAALYEVHARPGSATWRKARAFWLAPHA